MAHNKASKAGSSRMNVDQDQLRRADRMIWAAIAATATVVLAASLIGPFQIAWASFLKAGIACSPLSAASWFYRTVRKDPLPAAALTSTVQIIAFAMVGAPLSYIAATCGFPLQDATLQAWDRHLGVDWTELLAFVSSRPELQKVLLVAYSSFALQTVTTVLVLGISGQLTRLRKFIGAFVATTLAIIAISAIYPAAGPWLYLNVKPESANGFLPTSSSSWPVFLGLRDGTLHTVYGLNSEGIVTFPSLHAALGVLFPAALWHVSSIRWLVLALNGLLLLATPAYGSHYVVDVFAGIAIAAACWIAVARMIDAAYRPLLEHVATINDPPSIVPEALPSPAAAALSRENLKSIENKLPAVGLNTPV
jgi:hypothetical protein